MICMIAFDKDHIEAKVNEKGVKHFIDDSCVKTQEILNLYI